MLQILYLVGGIAALLVAVVEVREYFNEDRKNANLIVLTFSLIALGFAAHLFYFGPKAAGDGWVVALRNLDMRALRSATCDNSPIALGTSGINAMALELLGGLMGSSISVSDQSFTPILNRYDFVEREGSLFGGQGRAVRITLEIWRNGLIDFCVGTITEINGQRIPQLR